LAWLLVVILGMASYFEV